VRVTAEKSRRYRLVARAIDDECDTFVTLPGLGSFYAWTGQEPPTKLNASNWTVLFDDELQRRVIADLQGAGDLCLLRNKPIAEAWGEADGPLVSYLNRAFLPIARFQDYELLGRW
jgi:hypothetical protein